MASILDEVASLNEQRLYMSRIGSAELLQSMLLYDVMVFILSLANHES
ncbi:hypothetical protein HanRHA438_Chr14g0640531 [Helianthus annuus]|nr:hypothetical protein HanRHA438_Chr14g0640531 [Helianthus annuus]